MISSFLMIPMSLHVNHENRTFLCPGSEITCITALFYMIWAARFADFPSFHEFSWNSMRFMELS